MAGFSRLKAFLSLCCTPNARSRLKRERQDFGRVRLRQVIAGPRREQVPDPLGNFSRSASSKYRRLTACAFDMLSRTAAARSQRQKRPVATSRSHSDQGVGNAREFRAWTQRVRARAEGSRTPQVTQGCIAADGNGGRAATLRPPVTPAPECITEN